MTVVEFAVVALIFVLCAAVIIMFSIDDLGPR